MIQELESAVTKVPFDIVQPAGDELATGIPARYEAKLKRETRGTRAMMYLWTGESPSNEQDSASSEPDRKAHSGWTRP